MARKTMRDPQNKSKPWLPQHLQKICSRRFWERWLYAPLTEFILMGLIGLLGCLVVLEIAWEHREAQISHPPTVMLTMLNGVLWLFRIELILRFWVARRKRRFWQIYWLDAVALLPFSQGWQVLSLLRLWRLGELIKRRLSHRKQRDSGQALDLPISVTLILVLVVVGGTLTLYQLERQNPELGSLSRSFWYTVYTFISNEPQGTVETELGRVLTLLLMISGLLLFALVTGIVSAVMIERFQTVIEIRRLSLDELQGHILICGWNRNGHLILQELQLETKLNHLPIVIVTEFIDPAELEIQGVDRSQLYFFSGDYTRIDVLDKVGIRRASQAILLADSTRSRSDQDRDARTVLAALTIERLNPQIHTCAQLLDRQNDVQLRLAGVEDVVVGDEMTSYLIATSVRNQGLTDVLAELMTVQVGNQFYKITLPVTWSGITFLEASKRLKRDADAILLAVERWQPSGSRESLVNPAAAMILQMDDDLIVIARRAPKLPPEI